MKRPTVARIVANQFLRERPEYVSGIPLPVDPHYFRGPRGGRYAGYGPWTRRIGELGNDFIMDRVTVMDRGERIRYLRPGSAEWDKA